LQEPEFNFKTPGTKTIDLTVVNDKNCSSTVTETVTIDPTPVGKFTVTENYNDQPGTVKMNNFTEMTTGINFLWDFGDGSPKSSEFEPVATYSTDGKYTIALKTYYGNLGDGCEDITYYTFDLLFHSLYVPNAFRPQPSTSGTDNLFNAVGTNLKQYHIQIFDSFGRLMWESADTDDKGKPKGGWDGMYQGQYMPQGNYLWRISAIFRDDVPWEGNVLYPGDTPKTSGTFVLIR
jgi:gliding motility-associated-like protein